jgi:cell wall-associated NlpC family hydrolase
MTPEEIAAYVGKPYRLGAEGPDAFDCRGLVRHVLRHHFGLDIPSLPVADGLTALWHEKIAERTWETVEHPREGDGVIMRGGDDPHVGVYLTSPGAGVLHAFGGAGQVVWTPMGRLRVLGFSRLTFVRCHAAVAESNL